ncbi:pentatricopeptide repeat-containing protein 2, mitochondrial [Leptinotarsa decemlineata]|uniref:pentatricopeptide repeat-containing protein 2, mitochondrial n=1 Tax=Leptinotarsa decemlineata TaxID=7539 RepID=UPI000C252D46|nr:pentatricopeptide repeat-containing protein 2, mitochondrial-like [Leptinotarsa decemlineata]
MMANRIYSTLKNCNFSVVFNTSKMNSNLFTIAAIPHKRNLYSKETLGIDAFLQQCQTTQNQMENLSEKFKEKMSEYVENHTKHMVFTEDLKNMIHLSNNDKDLELVVKMIKKFNQQNKELRFGSFIFGPVAMRLFHHFNAPDIALECFKSPDLSGFFDQLVSYQILLDLLYDNEKYQEIIECADIIKDRQLEGIKHPRNIVVLVMAACYKMNSKESLDYALRLWQELKEIGHYPLRRATTFCAGLALNQGNPGVALEVLTSAQNQNYTTVRNLKVACLAEVGRVENAIPILKGVLSEDNPNPVKQTFNREVLEKVKNAVLKIDNPDLALEFNRIEQTFQKLGHISDTALDQQLCQEIIRPAGITNRQDRFQPRYRRPKSEQRTYSNKRYTFHHRPGLNELV